MSNDLNAALRQFDATEANLAKLERLWSEIQKLIQSGVSFLEFSPEARACRDKTRSFRNILECMPLIGECRLSYCMIDLDAIAEKRLEAFEIGKFEYSVFIEQIVYRQGQELREYRHRFDTKRRELVREPILKLIDEVDADIRQLQLVVKNLEEGDRITGPVWDNFKEHIAQIGTLLGSNNPRIVRWGDLNRHIYFHQTYDFTDISKHDWPAVKNGLQKIFYGQNDPVPVEVKDLSELVAARPSGPVATQLNWDKLADDEFERLIFCLIRDAAGYENPEWLTRTNAPDRGRDLSVTRVQEDPLCRTRRSRVIVQCKHWLKKSVDITAVTAVQAQMQLWEPPTVDVLIIATSGRFTSDAVAMIENHNHMRKVPSIEMWPESHLEHLLAARPHLIAEFRLR